MSRNNMFYLRLSESERDLLRALANHLQSSESQALRVCLATIANEINLNPSADLRGLVRKILQPNEVG